MPKCHSNHAYTQTSQPIMIKSTRNMDSALGLLLYMGCVPTAENKQESNCDNNLQGPIGDVRNKEENPF